MQKEKEDPVKDTGAKSSKIAEVAEEGVEKNKTSQEQTEAAL